MKLWIYCLFTFAYSCAGDSLLDAPIEEDSSESLQKQTITLLKELETKITFSNNALETLMQRTSIEEFPDSQAVPEDCSEVQLKGYRSGVYQVRPLGAPKPYIVYCDLDHDGGRWTVLQNRFNGKVDFYRNFSDYSEGFGEITGEHWAGLETMHQITSRRDYELYIELEDFDGEKKYALYKKFVIGSKEDGYRLIIGNYSGDAGDSMIGHSNYKFSTFDVDNDIHEDSCAKLFQGAWWYTKCHSSNLNGLYLLGETKRYAAGIVWNPWRGHYYSLRTSKMMIRPIIKQEKAAALCQQENVEIVEKGYVKEVQEQNKQVLEEVSRLKKDMDGINKRFESFENILTKLTDKLASFETAINGLSKNNEEIQAAYRTAVEENEIPEDCAFVKGTVSGVYKIKPPGAKEAFPVYCELNLLDQKWTVIQARTDGAIDFYRKFDSYEKGFGNIDGEHWLGLEKIYELTKNSDTELYIELGDFEDQKRFARYDHFSICSASDAYRLNIEGYSGDAGDSLLGVNGMKFSTQDRDLDTWPDNCAVKFHGAWWYGACHASNLNGKYHLKGPTVEYAVGVNWFSWHQHHYSLKSTRMLIRRRNIAVIKPQ